MTALRQAQAEATAITLPPLPWAPDALEPSISRRTIDFHYNRHHKGYVDNLVKAIAGTEHEGRSLEAIVRATAPGAAAGGTPEIFNNAAQAWNHTFYWESLAPRPAGPSSELKKRLESDLGGLDAAKAALKKAAVGRFGSGWAWLTVENGKLRIESTANAETPMQRGVTCLLTVDVWEHAYYLDQQNKRAAYVDAVVDNLLDWERASRRLGEAA